jgi:hypothetical protein
VAVAVCAALVAVATALPRNDLIKVAGSRLLIAATVAILVAAAAVPWRAGAIASRRLNGGRLCKSERPGR